MIKQEIKSLPPKNGPRSNINKINIINRSKNEIFNRFSNDNRYTNNNVYKGPNPYEK